MKVENLEFEIQQVGTTAASGIDKLSTALQKLNRQTNQTAIVRLNRQMHALALSLNQIDNDTVDKIERLANAVEKLATAAGGKTLKINYKDITQTANAATNAQARVNKELSQSEKLAKLASDGFLQMGTAVFNAYKPMTQMGGDLKNVMSGIVSGAVQGAAAGGGWGALLGGVVGGLSSALSVLVRDFCTIRDAFAGIAKTLGSKYLKAIWDDTPIAKFTHAVKNAVTKLSQLGAALARIALYRVLRTVIKEITSALEEGIKALYEFDAAASNVFAPTMDTIASGLGELKSNIATLAANIINLLAPAINTVLNLANSLVSAISSLFAALGGKVYYTATKQALKYADATDSAASSAAELNRQLMGFDEINKLSDSSSSGTTTSGFGWEESDLPDWAQTIKDLIDNGNWAAAGYSLANHLDGILKQFKPLEWGKELGEKIQHGINFAMGFFSDSTLFETIGSTIANALNGIVQSIDGGSIGELIAKISDSFWIALHSFITTFDLVDFAQSITDMMNKWVATVDTEMISDTLITVFGNVLDALAYFIENFDLSAAISKFAEFTKTLFEGIGQKLSDSDIADKLMEWIDEVDWEQAISDVAEGINKILDALVEQFNKLDIKQITSIISMMMQKIDFESIAFIVGTTLLNWVKIEIAAIWRYIVAWAKTIASVLSFNNWALRIAGYADGGIIKSYADGGIIKAANGLDTNQEGQLFIAREAGPELVGSFGNHTGVMNNDQIVAAVSEGVYAAVSSAMNNQSRNNSSITLNINGKQFARAVWNDMKTVQREHGSSMVNFA